MFAPRESPTADPTARQVADYIRQMAVEMADLAARCGRDDLAASLSIVALQAGAAAGRERGGGSR